MDYFNNNSRRLGDAQDLLENFEWTDDSLRDLESVNTEGTHFLLCGNRVKSTNKISRYKPIRSNSVKSMTIIV